MGPDRGGNRYTVGGMQRRGGGGGFCCVVAEDVVVVEVWAVEELEGEVVDDMQAASIRVQVVLDDDAAEGDGVEEFDLALAGLRTVADVRGAMAAMYADDGAAERALARRMVVQCLDDERGLLVALPRFFAGHDLLLGLGKGPLRECLELRAVDLAVPVDVELLH